MSIFSIQQFTQLKHRLKTHNALRITCKSGHEPDRDHEQILSGEFAGCEALRAERPADGIRSALLPARSGRQQRSHKWLGWSDSGSPVRLHEIGYVFY